MNAPVLLAQLAGSSTQTPPSPKNLKLEKPQNGQAVTVHLDGNTKLDFADVASEKLTFVRVGEKLIILFDNQSTVTVDPVFDSMGKPLTDLAFDMGSDRTLTGEQFAQTFPITTDQSVLPAAGGATGPTGGANFGDATVGALGASGARLALLTGEDTGGGFDNLDDGTPNPSPIPGGVTAVTLNEDGFAEGNPGGTGDSGGTATSVTGSLNVDFGTDFVNRSFAFSLNQPTLAGLTSDGQAVQLAFTTVNGQPVLIGYVGGDFTVAANQVFTVSLDASSLQGSYTFTLLRPLDHPIHGTEDTINLSINVIATDGSGDTAPVTISIGINDDTPVIGTPADAALTDPLSGNPATQTGSLGISWGADRYNDHVDGGVSATTGGAGDRSVVFAGAQVTATGDGTTTIGTLTSHGETVHYVLLENGTVLVAYTGDTAPTSLAGLQQSGEGGEGGIASNIVFVATLSDASNSGSYVVTQYRSLDHDNGSTTFQNIDLAFNFTATDSDGDTVNGTLHAVITDTVPVVTAPADDSTLSEGNGQTPPSEGGEEMPSLLVVGGSFTPKDTGAVSLHIDWRSDNQNPTAAGGAHDRSVTFTAAGKAALEALGLTSDGATIIYTISADGTLLTATTAATEGHSARTIFTVQLSDSGNGSYDFTLLDNLDHKGSSGSSQALTFGFIATDSDGDSTAPANFTVHITDDVPTAGGVETRTLSEQTQNGQTNNFVSTSLDNVSLNINWGADDANNNGASIDRKVAFTTAAAPSGLTSNGEAITYVLSENGTLLTASAGDRVVFTVKLSDVDSGTYTFKLLDNLDHVGNNGASIALGFNFTATDADGDPVGSSFTVNINDDVPTTSAIADETLVESTSAASSNAFIAKTLNGISLNVDWNSDDNNQVSGPGASDRSVAFTAATLTSLNGLHLTSNGTALTFSLSDNGQLLTAKAGGTTVFTVQLSDTANGTYTFKLLDNLDHASGNDKNDLALTFGFTATDSDGDTTAPASFTVHVTDDVPVAGVGDTRGVDEDDLLSGTSPNIFDLQVAGRLNIDWNSDDHDGGNVANRSVSFEHTTAADNVAVRDASNNLVNLTSDGATVHYALFGNDLVAYTGNNPFFNRVFVVSLDDDNTGSYTFTLLGHVDHPTADGQNTLTFTFDYTATDSDGDKSSSVFSVTVKDDVPTIGNTESESVREDSLPTTIYDTTFPDAPNSTVQLGDLNINWGADNNNSGTTNNRSVVFTTAAGATGLTSDGTAIVYSISADGTVLTAKAGSRTVFTIELSDSGDGSYKFTLFDNIDHAASGPNDDSRTLSFGIKATDSDGDSATANFAVTIVDDSPEAHTGDSRTINENDLSNGTSPNASGLTATGGLNISWGADDANPTSGGGLGDRAVGFRFSSAGDNVDAENSFGQNLTLRSDGQTVQYAFDGKTLVGYIGANLANGTRIFEVTLSDANDGSYTFKLLGNLDHPAGSGTNIVNLTFNYTATDGDGDTSNSVFTVTIRDDVPEIGAPVASSLTEDTTGAAGSETFVTQTALNKSLNINWGADDNNSGTANRSVAFASSIDTGDSVRTTGSGNPVLKSNGVTVQFLRISDTEIWGMANDNGGSLTINDRKVFHITLSDTGNGTYTFELLDNLDHVGSGQGSALSLQLGFVATDADGDTDSSSFTVTINDDNGRPSIGTAEAVAVDEDGLTGGNTQPAAGDLPGAATSRTGSLAISWGADDNNSGSADRSVAFVGITNGQTASSNAGSLTVDGMQVKLWVVGDTVYGYTGNNPPNGSTPPSVGSQVFTVSLSDLGAGSYTFNLLKHLDHPAGNNENDISLSFGYRATDSDGDVTATSTFTVTINDDSPVTTGAVTAAKVLDDDAFAGGNAGGADDVTDATSATGAAGALFSAGADGFKSVTLGTTTAFSAIYKDANGVAHQESVTWGPASVSGGVTTWTAIGAVSGATVATLAIGANGSYTFTTSRPLVHPTAGANEENLSLTFNYTVTDGDNDSATGSLTVNVNDDTPVSSGTVTAAATLDDEAQTLFPANVGGLSGDVGQDTNTASGAAGSLFTAGADGFKSVAMTSATFSVVYKDANGFALTETATWGSPVVGANGATTWTATSAHYGSAAVLVIGANGSYTLTVNAPIAHATPGTAEENKALTFNFTVTDGDGDTATGSLTVNVNDDTPVSSGIVTAAKTLDDEAQTLFPANTANVSGDVSPDDKTVSGTAGSLFTAGADGVKSVAMTSATFGVIYKDANGFAQTETATWGTPVVGANGATTWTATSAHYGSAAVLVINADGSYSFTVNAPVVHPTNSTTEENKALTFNFTVTDGDGDTATGSLTVNVNDDTVVLGTAVAGFVDEENLAGGNKNDSYPGDLTTAQGDNGTLSTSGSLAIAFGADGKAATVTGGTSTQTFTFSGNSTLTADLIVTQGTVNHPSASGIVFGGINNPIIINANDSLPFKLDAIDLGLSGAQTTPTVILKGYDANNNLVATYTLTVANVAALTSGTPTHFDATGTPFANVLIDRLEIYTGNGFNGYVMADNLVVTQNTASGPVVLDAAVTFTDHSNGQANLVVKDANGHDVTASLTSDGQAVHYAMIDAVTLIGYTGATAPTSLTDSRVVFSAVLSSASANGSYTFTQNANLDHPIAGQEDDLTFTFNFTAKDGDGDKANGHFTVTVDDDAPVATAAVLTGAVYENELSTATGDLSTGTQAGNADNKNGDAGTDDSILVGNLSSLVSMGADSPGTFVVETTNLSASLTSLTSGGVALTYTVVGNTLIAWAGTNQIFTFAVDATTGAYTFTLKGQIDHVANYVIDGASIPVAAIDQPGEIYAVAAINGNPRAFEGRLPDGDVIISVTNSGNTAVNWVLLNTDGGTAYPLSIAANTTIFINVGQISTPPNVHFELTGLGAPNGQTTVNSGHQDIVATGGTDALALDLSSAVTVRDGDGDTVALHDQLTVTIADDAPVIVSPAVVGTVDETNTPLAQVAYGSLKVTIGADKVGAHMDFATYGNGTPVHPSSVSSDGVGLNYVLRTTEYGEKQLVAFKFGDTVDNPVFIVALTSPANPTYIFTLFQNLDHAPNSNTMDLAFTIRVTDGDGDYVDQTIHVNVTDSVPTIPATTEQRADVQDDALINGNPEAGDKATASGTLSYNFGADSNGHLSWISATLPAGGFTSVINGNIYEVYQLQNSVNVKVFTVTLDPATGAYTVLQLAAVHHPDGNGEQGVSFNLTYRVTDGDGDYVDSYLHVVVGDDVPVIVGNATQANLLTNGDFSGGSAWHDASYGGWATGATGWKITGTEAGQTGVQLERVPSGYFGVVTSNGEPMVDLGATPGNIAVSQTLTGLTVGQHYTLSFEIGTYDPASSGLQVYWNGQLVGTYAPGSTMAIQTLDLIAAGGPNTVTFKEVGNASDNTGTYLANVSLVQASSTSLPLFHADIGEDGSSVVSLVSGTNYRFGADGPGSVAFDTVHATISTPTGTLIGVPSISYDPVTGKVTVNPGWGFNGLSEGEIATLSVPFTVTDSDGDTKTGIYQFTIHGTNDAVRTSEGFPDAGTMTEYAETDPRAGSSTDRVEFDAPPGYGGHNGGGFWIYDDQGDTHTLTITPQGAGYLGHLTAVVSEETVNDGAGFVNWQYHVTDADLNPLAQGETKVEKFTITVDDGHGSTTSREITVTLVGTNDSPVITTSSASAVVFENGDLDAIGADQALNGRFEPHINVDTFLQTHLVSGVNMATLLTQVQAAIGPQATLADAIATVWDYIDDNGGYYNNLLNEMSARLGVEYAKYLEAGGKPLLDVIAKFAADNDNDGTPDRLQSLHDNLLGNLHGASLIDKLLGAGQGSNPNPVPAVYAAIVSLLSSEGFSDLLSRPIYGGYETDTNTSLAWDQQHGLVPVAAGQLAATDVDHGAVLTWSGTTTTAFGTFAISASGAWSYTLNQSGEADKLAEGETKVETFTATVTDEFGATDTIPVTITIKGANDAPVITSSAFASQGTIAETGDLAGIKEAGVGGGLDLTPAMAAAIAAHPDVSTGLANLQTDPTKVHALLATIQSELGVDAATAIAIIWNALDDAYVAQGANQININQAFTRLGIEYAAYVKDGGTPLVDVIAKYTADANNDGIPERSQSLHDNLLGNLSEAALQQRYGADPLHTTFANQISAIDPDLLTRPYASGNAGDAGNAGAHAWDAANGFTDRISGQLIATDVDHGATQAWTITGPATYGTMTIDAATGKWTYTLDNTLTAIQQLAEGQSVTQTFTATVTDEHGATDTVPVTITIKGTNDAAVISGDTSGTATEAMIFTAGTSASGDLNSTDIDNPADAWTVVATATATASGYGKYTIDATGHWTYTVNNANTVVDGLKAGEHLSDTFTVTTVDGTPQTVTVTITGVNDYPVANDDGQYVVGEDVVTVFQASQLLANDTDAEHDTLTVDYVFATATGATATLNADGTISYDPRGVTILQQLAADQTMTDFFSYRVNDGHGGISVATVYIVVQGANDAPVVAVVTGTATEGGPASALDALANATDIDNGAILSVAGIPANLPAGVTYNASTHKFTLDPTNAAYDYLAAGQTTTVTVNYGVTDGIATTPGSVSWTLTGTNDAPVLSDMGGTASYTENGAAVVLDSTITIADVDDTNIEGATVKITGNFAAGQDVLAFTNQNGITGSWNATTGTLTLTGSATKALYEAALESITYKNTSENPSTADRTVSFSVTDGDLTSNVGTTTVHVTAVNDAPVIVGYTSGSGAGEDAAMYPPAKYVGTMAVSDPDGGPPVGQLVGTAISVSSGSLTPAQQDAITAALITGKFAFTDVTTDSNGNKLVNWELTAPGAVNLDFLAPGQTLTVTFNMAVSDGMATSSTVSYNIVFTGTNDAPVLTGDHTATVSEGGTYAITAADLGFSDPDDVASGVTFTASSLSHGTLLVNGVTATTFTGTQLAAGQVSFKHDGSEGGSAGFQINVEDGNEDNSAPVNQAFTFTVSPVNDGAASISITDTTQTATAPKEGDVLQANLGTDPDGTKTNIVYHWQSDGQDIAGATGSTYTLTSGDVGHKISVNVTYTDGQNFNENVTSAQTETVLRINHAPVAVDDPAGVWTATITEDSGVYFASAPLWNDSDPDGDAIKIISVQDSVGGTATLYSNGTVFFATAPNYYGPGSFTYTIADTHGATSTATVSFTIYPVNDAPDLDLDTTTDGYTSTVVASPNGVPVKLTSANVAISDVDDTTVHHVYLEIQNAKAGDTLGVSGLPSGYVATFASDYTWVDIRKSDGTAGTFAEYEAVLESVTFATTNSSTDQRAVSVMVADPQGGSTWSGAFVTINALPVGTADNYTIAEDGTLIIPAASGVLANDTDAENASLTAALVTGPAHGTLTLNADGSFTYTPTANYAGADSFTYKANDGLADSTPITVNLTVTSVNDGAATISVTDTTQTATAPKVGDVLQANLGTDPDGAKSNIVYHWQSDGQNIAGATGATYTLTSGDVGHQISVNVTYTDGQSFNENVTSSKTAAVITSNHAPDLVDGTYGGAVTGQVHALPASALVNGSFESGGTGWTVASQVGGASFSSNFPADGSGNFTANSFGQSTGIKTQLTQVVDTLPGLQYTLSFQVLTVSMTPGAHVYVNWNGVQVLAVATAEASGSYHTFTATVTGTGHDTLQFAVDDPNNNPATFDSWRFDAVSLTPAAHYESTSGTIAFTDLDAADTHSVTVSTPVGSNYVGTFVPTVDDVTHQVKWTFYASDTDLQAMTSNTANQTYTIKISDGHGGFDTQDVTVTVAKYVNAVPDITSPAQTGSVTEDASVGVVNLVQNPTFELPDIFNPVLTPWTVSGNGAHTAGSGANGSIDAAYLDPNSALSQTITTQIGTTYTIDFFLQNYGTPFFVTINGAQVWSTSNVIANWTEYSVTFVATTTSTVLSFATTGVNGASLDEVSVQAGTKHVVAGIETSSGTITYSDADLGDTHTVAASGPTFTWSGGSLTQAQITALTNASSLTLNATDSTGTGQGSVAWKHSIADSAIQFLNAGQTLTETYTVTIDDGQGGTTSQQVTITINGVNEPVAPTGQSGTLAITEDVTRVLTLSDFGYSDADGDAMASVKISSISITNGKLLYGTSQVTNNQVISVADILAGMLSFAPADDLRSGNSTNGTFAFKVTDSSGMTDATSRTMTLAIGADQFDAATSSSLGTTVTAAALNSGFGSYNEGGGSGDIFRISTSGATTYTNLNFLRSDNNLEIGWSASGGTGYATLLDQYGNSTKFFETFHFQNGGTYAGYTLSGTSSGGAYTLLSGLTSNSGSNLIIAGTEGNDTISTLNGSGNNLLFGNGGSDTITGGSGNDLIVGGLGNDTLGGWSGNDTYVFGLTDGNDTISEFTGTDRIVIKTGGAAMSGLFAYDNNATNSFGDLVIQYNGQQITVQNHFFMNGYEVEAINFDGGSVYGYALGSTDYAIPTGVTADPFEVNGYRTISIASGNNFISGEIDTANKITGGSGNDLIFGGDQGDVLAGGNGNNLIVGGKGNDTLSAGTGNDVYAFGLADGTDTITDASGTDAIYIATRGAAMSMLTATDNNSGTTHGDLVIQYNGQQVTVANHFDGGGAGANSIESISFDGGSVYGYDLGTGSYAISNLDPSNAGGARTVDLSASSVNNFIAGEDGAANVITGGSGKDLIFGGSQNDTLSGGAGNDLIQGGAGDDILMGGLGNDVLRGGSGADTFKFGAGHIGAANLDSILDFSNAEGDKIDISGLLDSIAGVAADGSNINNYVHLAQSGSNVLVQVDTTGTGNFSGNTHDVATLVGYGTSNADIVNMVFKNTDHTMTV